MMRKFTCLTMYLEEKLDSCFFTQYPQIDSKQSKI